ncbi:sugar kinase [uncultured Schumannella sp.]|uniref:sugar kinase n=1 Tax=uncultured Schumannella sp. TaxID=1195956 RepID=UPI0025F28B47|nr:sugar kinase [uncultured Schumannella sp.]
MKLDLLAVGETMALVTPASTARLEHARETQLHVAGAESTVALYLAEAGRSVAWGSAVGDDPLGRRILRELAEGGVDTRAVRVDSTARTGIYLKDPQGLQSSVHYYRDGSAASRLDADYIEDLQLGDATFLHLTGITPALSDGCRRLVERIVDRVSADSHVRLSFDVNFRPALWSPDEAGPLLAALATRADILFVGLDEAEALWGTRTPDDVRALLPVPGRLIVKDGAHGATEYRDGTSTFVAAPAVPIVEVIGAGDAFAAGYLDALLDAADGTAALANGHAFAARSLSSTSDFVRSAPCT